MTCARSALFLFVFVFMAHISELSAQYAQRIQPKDLDFGAGRIPASAAKQHINEHQTVCGRVTQVSKDGVMNLGEPGIYGMHGADLIAYAPAGIDVAPYYGTVACVSGHIQVKSFERGSPGVPVIYVQNAADITVIKGRTP